MSEMRWQPIETAPKDGSPFLTYSADADDLSRSRMYTVITPMLVMSWMHFDNKPRPIDEFGEFQDFHLYNPTHWMPLPSPPEPAE
jgi:hypothetical protein